MRIDIDEGRGNLNAKLLWAAQAGPFRLAHGSIRAVPATAGVPQQCGSCPGVADQVMFVGVALQANMTGPVAAVFGQTADVMGSNNVPAQLLPYIGALGGVSYSAILLPGEELYVQTLANTNLVFFSVGF